MISYRNNSNRCFAEPPVRMRPPKQPHPRGWRGFRACFLLIPQSHRQDGGSGGRNATLIVSSLAFLGAFGAEKCHPELSREAPLRT